MAVITVIILTTGPQTQTTTHKDNQATIVRPGDNQDGVFYVATDNTNLLPVQLQHSSMVAQSFSHQVSTHEAQGMTQKAGRTASSTMESLGATKLLHLNMEHTSAPYANHPTMVPNPAGTSDPFPIITPLIYHAWNSILLNLNLYDTFHDIPLGIQQGFDMGVKTPINQTYTPPNHKSSLDQPVTIENYILKESSAGRYTGPFTCDELQSKIGNFRTSPLGTVPKANSEDEFRVIQDFSYPRNDPSLKSVNADINPNGFTCDWGTFNRIHRLVEQAPPGTQAATMDVDAAFRCCPIRPSQQKYFVVQWENRFYIDHCAPFGASSSGGVFGQLADAMAAIVRKKTNSPCENWVDDFLFIRYLPQHSDLSSIPHYTYDIDLLEQIARPLGWPWKPSKTRPFANIFKYLGFIWDLMNKTVGIPDDKKEKYLIRLRNWPDKNSTFTKKEAETLLGTLVHCSLAIPEGRSYLPALSKFINSFRSQSQFTRRLPNATVRADMQWWISQLRHNNCSSKIIPPPTPSNIEFWVDASTSWGIGVILKNEWKAWELKPGWNVHPEHTIGWAEILAIECGLRWAIHKGFKNIHFILKSDNTGVIDAISNGKSRSEEQNKILRHITILLQVNTIWLTSQYVASKENLADRPSRGLVPPGFYHCNENVQLSTFMNLFI